MIRAFLPYALAIVLFEALVLVMMWALYRLDRQAAARREIQRLRRLHEPYGRSANWPGRSYVEPVEGKPIWETYGAGGSEATYDGATIRRMGGTFRSSWDSDWGEVSWLPREDLEHLVRDATEAAMNEPRPVVLGMDWYLGMRDAFSASSRSNGSFSEHARRERRFREVRDARQNMRQRETKSPH